jgi:hypothetical protein
MIQPPPTRNLLVARAVLGVIGLLLTIPAIGVVLSMGTGGPLDPIGSQTRAVSRTLDEVERALSRVRATMHSAGTTLDDARTTAGSAAGMTDALSQAMADLATASGVEVLGVKPFGSLGPRFSELATRATAVADALRTTATNLGTSRTDLDALAGEVTSLAALTGRIGGDQAGGASGSLVIARILLALLLAWMAATAGLSVIEARRQLRLLPASG